MTLYNQAIAHRFGIELRESIESGQWTHFDFAVAWVRRTGIRHLEPALRSFLQTGGVLRAIVGVDLENTSHEGLKDLLALCESMNGEVFVYHNEADVTFHPKLYLLSNSKLARLIVGSNNLTEAGLFTNTEVGLEITVGVDEPVISDARAALESWSDITSGLTRKLDCSLLADLLSEGYVLPEKRIRERISDSKKLSRPTETNRRKLFGTRRITPPSPPTMISSTEGAVEPPRRTVTNRRRIPGGGVASTVGNVLLMRVRRASETERRTQIQLPVQKLTSFFQSNFFEGISYIKSAHDGREHQIRQANARGNRNTTKLEVPEIAQMNDPVLRLERNATEIVYEAYDRSSPQGKQIMKALDEGRLSTPPTTMLTVNDVNRATMARHV